MHCRGDKATVGAQVVDAPAHFLAHFVRRAGGEDALRIDQPAPEGHVVAEVALERRRFHAHGADLYRVDDVDADLDHVGDDLADGAARVEEDLGVAARLDKVHDLLVARLDDLAIGLRVDEQPELAGQVIGLLHHVGIVAHKWQRHLPVGQLQVDDGIHQVGHPVEIGDQVGVEVGKAACPRRQFHKAGRQTTQDHRLTQILGHVACALLERGEARRIHGIGPGEVLDVVDAGRVGKGMVEHVIVEAAVLRHAPADPPLVVEEAIAGHGILVDDDLEGGRRARRHVATVAAQLLPHILVDHGDLLEDVHDLDILVG